MKCTLHDVATSLASNANAEKNPWWENPENPSDWNDIFHTEQGAAAGILSRTRNFPDKLLPLAGAADSKNPVLDRLLSKTPEHAKRFIFDSLSPKESVAKPILEQYVKIRSDFEKYLREGAPEDNGLDVYQEQIVPWARELREKIEREELGSGEEYGLDWKNEYPTIQFLKWVENGSQYADFGESRNPDVDAAKPFKALTGNLRASHVTLSPTVYMFHMGSLPLRVFSQYPMQALKSLGTVLKNPKILLGWKIPEAEKAGFYSKALPTEMKDWEKGDWANALTTIPQAQTTAESLAYLIHKEGVGMDEVLDNVALRKRDPLESPMWSIRPDREGAYSYIRYSLMQSGWYLNLLKRLGNIKDPEGMAKAGGALLMYSALNYYTYGSKAAIPFGGTIAEHVPGSEDVFEDIDESGGGNQVYKATGLDLGGNMSPLEVWQVPFYPYKMLYSSIEQGGKDAGRVRRALEDESYAEAGLTAAHGLLLGASAFFKIPGTKVAIPYSGIKAVGAYARSVNEMAGDPLKVDYDTFAKNMLQSYFGKEVAKRFEEK